MWLIFQVYGRGGKSIVFTQTKKDADEVSQALSRLVGCEALHGDITQNRRESIMKSFRDGKFSVLVATDVAARGLDISDVDLIIHYEIPNDPETFVHRSGRTGRAGKEGTAILMHTQQERRTLFRIEQDVGCKFEQIDPPHVSDVLRSSSAHATAAISKVHPEVKKYFLPTAEQLLEDKGIDALAAAIAHISGFSQPPVSRSLITHEEGSMTLRIVRSGRGGPPLISARSVMGTLAEIYPIATQNMGKICMIDEPNVEGAVFDLPEDVAKELLTKQMNPGDSIDVPAKLPRIQEDFSGRSSYGRFSSRGSFSGRGGQDFDFRGQGGRPSSRFRAQDDSFGYGGRTRSRDDDRFDRTFSRSVDRTRSMGGACFVCGQVGHKAVDCPEKRRR
ncbi:hypothetical protein O6H91_Y539700 [Diphasiastrum complanatum]|nr:hypothetical protein O6H91_Y539700 [Diphasiastrum complanatum]